jgi:hypothetical protein
VENGRIAGYQSNNCGFVAEFERQSISLAQSKLKIKFFALNIFIDY